MFSIFFANSDANASENAASIPPPPGNPPSRPAAPGRPEDDDAGPPGTDDGGNVDVGGGADGIWGDLRESRGSVGEKKEGGGGGEMAPGEDRDLVDGAVGVGLWEESNWSRTSEETREI